MKSQLPLCMMLTSAALLWSQNLWSQNNDSPLSSAEQAALTRKIPFTALRFRGQLPNFIATEQEMRWTDASGSGTWKKHDSLEMLVYFTQEGRTGVKLLKLNGKATRKDYDQEAGAKDPEFLHGAILPTHLFGPKAETEFTWNRWEIVNGRRLAVFAFRAKPVFEVPLGDGQSVKVGFHGLVYADPSTAMVWRLETTTDPPPGYPFDQSGWSVDYGVVALSGKELMLPLKAVTHYRRGKAEWKNEIEFSGYRKYEADSTVTFQN